MAGAGPLIDWPQWLDQTTRETLEAGPLPHFLGEQRWFAGRARGLAGARFVDVSAPLAGSVLTILDVLHGDGTSEPYFLPIRPCDPSTADRWTIAPGLRDALTDAETTTRLVAGIGDAAELPTRHGVVRGVPTSAFDEARGVGPLEPRYGWIEQSHSAVRFDDRLFLKVFRKLTIGPAPDFEVGRFLTEQAQFDRVPQTAGALVYERPDQDIITLGVLQSWVPCVGTGWDRAQAALVDAYRAADPLLAFAPEVAAAATLGRRAAELHRALASGGPGSDFSAEAITLADVREAAEEARSQVQTTLEALKRKLFDLPETVAADAHVVLDRAPLLEAGLVDFEKLKPSGKKIRVHGDLHLGQVLRTVDDDFFFIDFEGEPIKALERRRARQSVMKDLVGMMRSFDYAAFGAFFALGPLKADESRRHLVSARAFRDRAWDAFWSSYRGSIDADLLPNGDDAIALAFRAHALDKTLYELLYELNHRPDWVRIPLQGVLALVGRPAGTDGGPSP